MDTPLWIPAIAAGTAAASTVDLVDPLTNLTTRRGLMTALDAAFMRSPAGDAQFALLVLKITRFREVNRAHGRLLGDALLRRIATRLCRVATGVDTIARVSGLGFAILLNDASRAAGCAGEVLTQLRKTYIVGGRVVNIGAAIGFATARTDGADAHALLHAADLAMNATQHEDDGLPRRFEPGMRLAALRRQELENDLRSAIALQASDLRHALSAYQFVMHYQPIVTVAERRLVGFEALIRWQHPKYGMVQPTEFIPIAEEIGMIGPLGDFALHAACRAAATWPCRHDGTRLRVAVNLSPLQLRDGQALLHGIRDALADSGLPAALLELELTETALTEDAGECLHAIRALGVSLALDDFGAGHSSLGRLSHYPFTRLKIDRSFVEAVGRDDAACRRRADTSMVHAIALLGQALGLTTLIEGIENNDQLDLAQCAGCTEMQGYLVSRPVPAERVGALVRDIDAARASEGPQ